MLATLATYVLSAGAKTLNVTAITGRDGESVFECWSLLPPLVEGGGLLSTSLGDLANASYAIVPPGFDNGPHNAPANQWVVLLSGVARITIPHVNQTVYVLGGTNGVIFAGDIAAVSASGHVTANPSEETARVLQIPSADGKIPTHQVAHDGPCTLADM
ncbi:hypothetical protein AURDEDRAFT_169804 [Auricularia subglabra TFB-10046 SS5]|nr:hypothetical protein AURDEDRAFT_169804 [Auricularia subglabra TFB-10046 SS5]